MQLYLKEISNSKTNSRHSELNSEPILLKKQTKCKQIALNRGKNNSLSIL